jgi:tetratricopeptide (TPR) repeat protein
LPEDDPLLAQAWGLVGLVHQASEDWPAARLAFQEALTAASQTGAGSWQIGRLLLNLGETCLALGQPQEALDVFQRGLAMTQSDGLDALWGSLTAASVIALARLGQTEAARERLIAVRERAGEDERLSGILETAYQEAIRFSICP